jgi:hypothetical protein
MSASPKLPSAIVSEGLDLALLDATTIIAMTLSASLPGAKDAICGGLRERFQAHQKVADEHGTAANVNAASALRLIMIQVACENVPDHE